MRPATIRWRSALGVAALTAAACAPAEPELKPAEVRAAPLAPPVDTTPLPARRARSADPRVVALRGALEFGDLGYVREHLADADLAPDEAVELRARAAAMAGRTVEALRLLEGQKRAAPADPASYAALAEIYGQAGKFETAWQELGEGDRAAGAQAELVRARGILWILREGGAQKGLELLERARRADPEIAFAQRALAQAHLLIARRHAQAEEFELARAHVKHSLSFDARDVDALRLDADLAAAAGEFSAALATMEGLLARGEPLQGELALLHKKAAFGALLAKNRELALERFQKARALGLTDAELASGAELLAQEGARLAGEGLALYQAEKFDEARATFERALGFDPGEITALNWLATLDFKVRDYPRAAERWRAVLDVARAQGLELPEPVHLNLAKALKLAGRTPEALELLSAELARDPEGRWAAPTQALLKALRDER